MLPSLLWGPNLDFVNALEEVGEQMDHFSMFEPKTGRVKRVMGFTAIISNPGVLSCQSQHLIRCNSRALD